MADWRPTMTGERNRPTFSISLPALGQAEFVGTALSSIRVQQVPLDLAVLDASPDDRVQDVLRADGVAVAYGYHHPDDGQAAAIQEGWDRTGGQIVAWLCADDYYFPDTLGRVADVFRTHPDTDVVFGHGVHVSEEGAFEEYFPSTDPDPAALFRGCSICQPACFVRREAMERIGGLDTSLHYCMDWDFWLRLHESGARFRFLDELLVAVRVHSRTKTQSGGRRRRQEIDRFLSSHGVGPVARWRAALAFLRQDVRPSEAPLLRRALDVTAAVTWRARGEAPASIRGLECRTNRVQDRCTVELPWYGDAPARQAILVADQPIRAAVTVNDQPTSLGAVGMQTVALEGRTVQVTQYTIPLSLPQSDRLSFRFGQAVAPWRLLGLEVR
jgi:GT2 family glycosyltransferase